MPRAVRLLLVVATLAALVAPASPLVATGLVPAPRAAAATGATTTDYLNLRDGPGLNYSVLLVMPTGASVSVTGDAANGFYPVNYAGRNGWAFGDYLRLSGLTDGGAGTATATTTDYLNFRTGPSLNDAIMLVMPPGASVTLTGGQSGQFVAIRYGGNEGWASRDYLRASSGSPPAGTPGGGSSGGAVGGTATVLDGLYLRSEPNFGSTVFLTMPTGARVDLTGERNAGFAEVVYNGRRGWAFSTFLDDGDDGRAPEGPVTNPGGFAPPAPGSGTAVVTASLYLRSAASFSSGVRTTMPAGAVVNLSGSAQSGFYLVVYNGTRGWASATYLLTSGRPNDEYNYPQALIERFIVDAARRYGQDPDALLRVARCESNLNAQAVNPAGSYGLFQFVRGTWESTPFADHDVFEAWANANAAAWMWAVGRRHEWVCR